MENRLEVAKKYFAENPNPIQDICPEIIQYWRTTKGTMYWSNKTGKRTYSHEKDKYRSSCVSTSKTQHDGVYVHYVDDLDAIEVSRIRLDTPGRGVDGQKADWEFAEGFWYSRYLIFRGDTNAYSSRGEFIPGGKYYCKTVADCITGLGGCYDNVTDLQSELSRFDKEWSDIKYRWQFADRYKRMWVPRTTSKRAKAIDTYEFDMPNLNNIELEDKLNASLLYCQILDDKFCVLRRFKYERVWNSERRCYESATELSETLRIFVDDKGKPSVYTTDYGKWVMTTRANANGWSGMKMVVVNPDVMQDWKPLKYIYPLLEWNRTENLSQLCQIMRHPIVEQLSKAGYPCLAMEVMRGNQVPSTLRDYFMCKRETKQQMYKLLGVNKYILSDAEKMALDFRRNGNRYRSSEALQFIQRVKQLYDRFDVSDLSKETVEFLTANLVSLGWHSVYDLVGKRRTYWNRNEELHIEEDERNFIFKLFRMNSKSDTDLVTYYFDTQSMYSQLINKPEIDLHDFDSYEGLRRIHDALQEFQRIQNANRQAEYDKRRAAELEEQKKKFAKLQDERVAKFEADGNEFCIRVPHSLEEITREGSELHHCVGSYLGRHAEGHTNIIFLRRKGAEETPFYTIEVCNNKVVQIHGKNNRWLGNDPEAVPFVYQWLKERGIEFNKNMLLNKGAGYGAGKECLPESYLTKLTA